MSSPDSIDAYISGFPENIGQKLKKLHSIIKGEAPDAEEKISYGMPYYGYKGRLAYFAVAKNHIGLYIPPPVIQDFADDLKDYETAKATIQFPFDKELPVMLIKKLIEARVRLNEAKKGMTQNE